MKVALLTNFIAPYRLPFFRALATQVGELRVFISTPMEANRSWSPQWDGLDVVLQRTVTLNRTWRGEGFRERVELHLPLDTRKLLDAFEPNLVMSGEFGLRSVGAARYAKAHGIPLVLWATLNDRLETRRGRVRTVLRRWLLRQACRVIVNGENGARYIRRFGYPDARIARIPQTTALDLFFPLPLERGTNGVPHLLYVGHVSELKGIAALLDALASSPDLKTVRLTVLGDGPLLAELERRSQERALAVNWVGAVPYAELPRWYAQADFLIFPTLGDEWGMVVNEALAAGLPVIGSSHSQAVEELVRDGENGWVFTPADASSVRQAIERALSSDPARVRQMRANARQSIAGLTPENVARRFHEVLEAAQSEGK